MPKKGERATHRVVFDWANGVKGTISCISRDQAEDEVRRLRETALRRDLVLRYSIEEMGPR